MSRKKVKLVYISNDSARKATYKKRKRGLLKKISELTTLCGVDACVIIYSPYETEPEAWPSPSGAERIVAQFKKMPDMEQSKKMVNQESFIRQRIAKASDQLKKQRKDNREVEITRVMFHCMFVSPDFQGLTLIDLNDLAWLADQYLKETLSKMESMRKDLQVGIYNDDDDNNSYITIAAATTNSNKKDNGENYNNNNNNNISNANSNYEGQQYNARGYDQAGGIVGGKSYVQEQVFYPTSNVAQEGNVINRQPWFLELLSTTAATEAHMGFGATDDHIIMQYADGTHDFNSS